MLILISPAKSLDFESEYQVPMSSQPEFIEDSKLLVSKLKKLSSKKIGELMKISATLSDLNYDRYQSWNTPFTETNAKHALLVFTGDVYRGLNAKSFNEDQLNYAQKHLKILSGLYGLLRPLDLIQPYRLEMGTRFQVNAKEKNLYSFWQQKITEKINESNDEVILNLASNEYSKAIDFKATDAKIISPQFKDFKNGQYKTIMTFAKLARGYMTNYVITNKIEKDDDLKGFDYEGYTYNNDLSNNGELVFTRG